MFRKNCNGKEEKMPMKETRQKHDLEFIVS